MSFRKYLLSDAERRAPRSAEGYPMRGGAAPVVLDHEYDEASVGADAHVRVFATDSPEDLAAYTEVLDRIANGLFVRLAPDRDEFVAARGAWLVLCRWAALQAEAPTPRTALAGGFRP